MFNMNAFFFIYAHIRKKKERIYYNNNKNDRK